MPLDPKTLEPAVRDPKKLRRTAFILVGIIFVGGFMVLMAYKKWGEAQNAKDALNPRAAVIGRLDRDLQVLRQDGSEAALLDLSGKVWLVCVVSASSPETSARSVEVMKHLVERYQTQDDVVFVSLVIDTGKREDLDALVKSTGEALGAKLPKWWVASAGPDSLPKYIKNQFKPSLYPAIENGKWKYDTSIVLIDRNRHVRNAVIPQKRGGESYVARFDFDQAGEWDARGVKTGTGQTNVQELENVLVKTIEQLRLEPLKD